MSYDDEVRETMDECVVIAWEAGHIRPGQLAADSIKPCTLKTDDGVFVRVRPFWDPMRGWEVPGVYEVVPEDQP